jgi:hypothetical protein
MTGDGPRRGRRQKPRPSGRGPYGRGEPTPGGRPRFPRPVAARRYAPTGTSTAWTEQRLTGFDTLSGGRGNRRQRLNSDAPACRRAPNVRRYSLMLTTAGRGLFEPPLLEHAPAYSLNRMSRAPITRGGPTVDLRRGHRRQADDASAGRLAPSSIPLNLHLTG